MRRRIAASASRSAMVTGVRSGLSSIGDRCAEIAPDDRAGRIGQRLGKRQMRGGDGGVMPRSMAPLLAAARGSRQAARPLARAWQPRGCGRGRRAAAAAAAPPGGSSGLGLSLSELR